MKDRYLIKLFFVGLAGQLNIGADWAFDTEREARKMFEDVDVKEIYASFDKEESDSIRKVRLVFMDTLLNKCLAEKSSP